jgi:hypothetical protein
MLRLVHPAPEGQGPRAPRVRPSRSLLLSDAEIRHVRAALRGALRAYGGRDVLAGVIGVPEDTLTGILTSSKHRASGTFAIRLASAIGASVESVLTGAMNEAGRCKTCGHRAGAGRVVAAAGGAS